MNDKELKLQTCCFFGHRKIAYKYAKRKGINLVNVFEENRECYPKKNY